MIGEKRGKRRGNGRGNGKGKTNNIPDLNIG